MIVGKIPDFIIHTPNTSKNLAVIEFKISDNNTKIEYDFGKLVGFKKDKWLEYKYCVEVIIGNDAELKKIKKKVDGFNNKNGGEEIVLIWFDYLKWSAEISILNYKV